MINHSNILVVGASGILAPAVKSLLRAGHQVTGISRSHPAPDGAQWVRTDTGIPGVALKALDSYTWDLAIVYEPAVCAETLNHIRAHVTGRTVLVQTSGAADPSNGFELPSADCLVLGWKRNTSNGASWHSPDEVSTAALKVLTTGKSEILGEIRPWSKRPA